MALTTTAFEVEIIGFAPSERGWMAAAAYRLRQNYQEGMTDPAAHNDALIDSESVSALARNAKTASFAAITAP
jgi:hypothetical protein